ncbi:MAG: FAD-binding oxidoreductase [Planctomycetes bacterium]|nr:FAD-binding oxidoreductase [Planctomycetota bacterium]
MSKNYNKYDVIVIGAGSVGNPTAYFLAKEGKKVLCLEMLPAPGQGQNKAAIGGVRATHSDPAKRTLCPQSLDIFAGWQKETGVDIGYKKGGYAYPVYREQDAEMLKSLLPIQKKFKLNIDFVDAQEMSRIVQGIQQEGLLGGTFSPDDAQVSPLMSSASFYRVARDLGADYHFNESVVNFIKDGSRIIGVHTDKSTYHADMTVIAAGAEAEELCRKAGVDVTILPDSHEAGICSPVQQFLDPLVVDIRPGADGKTTNFYFGQNHEGQIIFCYTPSPVFPGISRDSTSEFMPILARRMVELIPRFRNLVVRRIWRGLYPMSVDAVPIIGKYEGVDGLILAVAMCGQGFMLGPGVALNLCSEIIHGKPMIEQKVWDSLSPNRDFSAAKVEKLK